jgi:hypothetical protein
MFALRIPLCITALALVLPPSVALGQPLTPGTWTGTVSPPNEATVNATFDVRVSGDSVSITMKVQFGDFRFTDIKVEADRLTFTFTPGTPVRCTLSVRDDGSYSGDCVDPDGDIGVIVMTPPAKSDGLSGVVPRILAGSSGPQGRD